MDQKSKIIIVALGLLTCVICIFAVMVSKEKETLMKEYQDKRAEWSQKEKKFQDDILALQKQKSSVESRLSMIQRDLDSLREEEGSLRDKYNVISAERDELVKKLKKAQDKAVQRPVAQASSTPQASLAAGNDEYWAKILKDKAALEFELDSSKEASKNLKMKIDQLIKEKTDMELELTNVKRKSSDLERRYSYNEKLLDSLSSELVREKNDKKLVEEQNRAVRDENIILRRSLKQAIDARLAVKERLASMETEKARLENKVERYETVVLEKDNVMQDASDKVTQIKGEVTEDTRALLDDKAVELSPIVVRSPEAGGGLAVDNVQMVAKVVALDSSYNFVVFDLGEEAGVKIGMNFEVYRNNQRIATVRVIQTRRSISAADIVQSSAPVKVGDIVRQG